MGRSGASAPARCSRSSWQDCWFRRQKGAAWKKSRKSGRRAWRFPIRCIRLEVVDELLKNPGIPWDAEKNVDRREAVRYSLIFGASLPQTDPSASRVPRRRWRIAFLLALGVLVNFFDRINLSVSREALNVSFGMSLITFGYISSAFSWTYALMQMPAGILLDRLGVRRVGRISAFLWSVASFAAAAAPGLNWFFGARLVLGISESPTFPANAKALGYWFTREERSLATAITDAAAKFSTAIGVPLIGLLLLHFGWRWSFAATGFISFLYFVLFYFIYRKPRQDRGLTPQELEFIVRGGAQLE